MLTAEQIQSMPFLELLDELADAPEQASDAALWMRYDSSLLDFAVAMFPDRFTAPFNRLHFEIGNVKKTYWKQRDRPSYEAWAAPRGAAKSTLASFADVVHDVCYGYERFIGLISTSFDLSEALVKDLYDTFQDGEGNEELHRLYGPFDVRGTKTDFIVRCPSQRDKHGIRIKAYSMGGQCRGHKHAGTRFTKWILDDAERSDRVHNPRQRDLDEAFLAADIAKAGGRYTIVRMMGTVLHPDSVLARKLDPHRSPSWRRRFFQAIIKWPHEVDGLWEGCRAIWTDLRRGGPDERRQDAEAFYADNREAMDDGAVVMWPAVEPLFDLMLQYWENRHAFFAEKQNEPNKSGERTFDVDAFRWVAFDGRMIETDDGRSIPLTTCKVAVWWDPTPYNTKQTGRDAAGYAVVARDRDGGIYVLEARTLKAPPDRQWDHYFSYVDRYPTAVYGYESNTGDPARTEEWARRVEQIQSRHRRFKPAGYQTKGKKEPRIADIQPACENGFIRFSRTGVESNVLDQFRHFPDGRFDDGIDAIERAVDLLSRGQMAAGRIVRY